MKTMVKRGFNLKQQENTKGFKEQRQTQNTNEIMMKLEQDTATEAGISMIGDKWRRRQIK
jgi:hypothetical protein